jgi:hypothetical protein
MFKEIRMEIVSKPGVWNNRSIQQDIEVRGHTHSSSKNGWMDPVGQAVFRIDNNSYIWPHTFQPVITAPFR